MMQNLETARSNSSNEKAKKLIAGIASGFEAHPNNDLNVKAAFDILHTTIIPLHKLMKQKKLSAEEAKAAMQLLRLVDSVLQVTF